MNSKETTLFFIGTKNAKMHGETIKNRLANAPIMGYPDFKKPLFMHTDACKSAFAAILTQEQKPGVPAEKNDSSAKSESACIIWAAKRRKHYLSFGIQFLCRTKKNESSLTKRRISEMEGFQYKVEFRNGKNNIADFLSRQNDKRKGTNSKPSPQKEEASLPNPQTMAPILTWKRRGDVQVDYDTLAKKSDTGSWSHSKSKKEITLLAHRQKRASRRQS